MKPYQRRAADAYPYFKLATFDPINLTWRDGKIAFPSADAAQRNLAPGRYRISEVTEAGRRDLPPFDVA